MMGFKRVFVWHMDRGHWEQAMEKYELISKSLKNVHQRFLDKGKNTRPKRPLDRKN